MQNSVCSFQTGKAGVQEPTAGPTDPQVLVTAATDDSLPQTVSPLPAASQPDSAGSDTGMIHRSEADQAAQHVHLTQSSDQAQEHVVLDGRSDAVDGHVALTLQSLVIAEAAAEHR